MGVFRKVLLERELEAIFVIISKRTNFAKEKIAEIANSERLSMMEFQLIESGIREMEDSPWNKQELKEFLQILESAEAKGRWRYQSFAY